MTKQELIEKLKEVADRYNDRNQELGHSKADDLLIKYINDPEITEAFNAVHEWYA